MLRPTSALASALRMSGPQSRLAAARAFSSIPSWATIDPVKLSGDHPGEGFNLGASVGCRACIWRIE